MRCAASSRWAARSEVIHASNARRIYAFTSGESADDPRRWRHITQAPPVPATAIYSRSDGVVAWQDSVEPSNAAHAESIRVFSSHVGMAVHPAVLYVLAERLAQPEGQWQVGSTRWRAAASGWSALKGRSTAVNSAERWSCAV
jgi:hypothetical protein